MAPTVRVRPYKDFLTPALHRRFSRAAAFLFCLCYVESLLIGEWNSMFWSWFPFGIAGIRTGLLFIPAFMIFILRISQLHVGYRTSYSAWDTFKTHAGKFQVVQTVGWYCLSAYLFSEVYIWSSPRESNLSRIQVISKTDRTTLNEDPIYLTGYLIFLGLLQAGFHLYCDYDRLNMPSAKTSFRSKTGTTASPAIPPATQLRARFLSMSAASVRLPLALTFTAPIIYCMPLGIWPHSFRQFAWRFTRSWARIFWNLPKSSALPTKLPFHWTMLVHTIRAGVMLVMLWEVGNAAFTVYVAQEPLKNDRPITYESRDPNGSLLTGLTGKKLQTRTFAFWELVYIGERFEGRRKAIFEDIDRTGGSTWSQILEASLAVVNGVQQRIEEYERPASDAAAAADAPAPPANNIPRLTEPLKDGIRKSGDLFGQRRSKSRFADDLGASAKALGQSSTTSNLSPKARRLFETAEAAVLTPEQKAKIESVGVTGLVKDWAILFLRSPVGTPFRQEYRRRLAAIVLGSPFGDVGIIVDAVDALTRFSVCSLTEDKYGNVQRDVPLIIRTLTTVITKLEKFRQNLPLHWTDVEKSRECPEVEEVMVAMKTGLTELITAFGDYSHDLRISPSELRLAKLAAQGPQMQQKK